jgi:predicted amidohydrolase YtcJ|tara:strand:+ start:1448 stop:3130 length:1683 start_codon:yes stop_codon:yes gene_type:complete
MYKYKNLSLPIVLVILFSACSKEEACIEADLVVFNTNIYTGFTDAPKAEALAIKDKKFIFVGSNSEASVFTCGTNKTVDLQGVHVYPGFIDAHAHLKGIGYREMNLNLQGAESLKSMLTQVEIHSNKLTKGSWVVGRGWIEKKWPEARFPTLEELNAISEENPIALERADGHAIIVNSLALEMAGIDRDTPNPIGGKIDKDENGEPNGVLIDKASLLVETIIPKKSRSEEKQALREGLNRTAEMGWTQLHDAGSPLSDYELLKEIKEEEGMPVRIQFYVSDGEEAIQFIDNGPYLDEEHMLTARGVKLYADGAIGSRGAAFFEKYDDYETRGFLIFQKEETMPKLIKALVNGIQIQTHAIGDLANKVTLDWYKEAFDTVSSANRMIIDPRWRVEHSQNIRPSDQQRFADMNIIASMQPSHAIGDLHFAHKRLGEDRLENAYTWRSLIDLGVLVAGGSDAPVEIGDPRIEFKAAVSRKDLDGYSQNYWNLDQSVTREEALYMFTKWAAYSVFEEDIKGTIEVGKLADLTIFSKDLMTIPDEEIMSAQIKMTVVGGKIVYSK